MGKVITKIPIEYAADGYVTKTANLLTQYHQITLEDMQRSPHKHFNTPIAIGTARHR